MPTGPQHYHEAESLARSAHRFTMGDGADPVTGNALATEALMQAVQALTAAVLMSVETRGDYPPYEMEAWRRVIPAPPLKECKGKEARRPKCAERHTDDCEYADPPPPKPTPDPVKQEPTAPRIYVQHIPTGRQGYLIDTLRTSTGRTAFKVTWFTSKGLLERTEAADQLDFIQAEDIARCENGQTLDECSEGEDQCELCRQAEDEEAAEIERSMGLRSDSSCSPGCSPLKHRH